MFRRVLIANRGEIAARIARACRAVGAEPVGVHSEADRDAPWLAAMERSVCIGPARADRSYLDATAILQAAEQTDCQAIHPGYGFLAENAVFSARCAQQGFAFVGPSPTSIRLMGDKTEAKVTMQRLGLPTVPGSEGALGGPQQAREIAESIGFPVLLKAAAGGGGRGMRRCDDAGQVEQIYGEASLEAAKSFGDPTLYLERFLEGGRHIEFQVLGDGRGNAVHLGERECSIQRKHQKLIEESPSPVLGDEERVAFGDRVSRAVGDANYRGAGTVEFLRDPDGALWFMEMNTRLQVEHPVTEMVTGIDLVVEQLRIAAGATLSLAQPDIRFAGHAIEFRINAEDPDDGFRPDPGRIDRFVAPPETVGAATVRWDSAVVSGYRIPPHYDSMIGKLIVHAADRPGALKAAEAALAALKIEGVRTTIPLHLRILKDPEFVAGEYDIHTLPRLLQEPA